MWHVARLGLIVALLMLGSTTPTLGQQASGSARVCNKVDKALRIAYLQSKSSGQFSSSYKDWAVGWIVVQPGECGYLRNVVTCGRSASGYGTECRSTHVVYYAELMEGPVGTQAHIGGGDVDLCVGKQHDFAMAPETMSSASACAAAGGKLVNAVKEDIAGSDLTVSIESENGKTDNWLGRLIGQGAGKIWDPLPCPKTNEYWNVTRYDSITCTCSGSEIGNIAGLGSYTNDSSICPAAMHDGVLPVGASGEVTINFLRAVHAPVSVRNGIRSGAVEKKQTGFAFAGSSVTPPRPDFCPATAQGLEKIGAYTCFCYPDQAVEGQPIGSNPYALNSPLCASAVHAGAIEAEKGGMIAFGTTNRTGALAASERNRVVSSAVSNASSVVLFNVSPLPYASCPATAAGLHGSAQPFICHCPSVWNGDVFGGEGGVYADTSSICRAAVHAGILGGDWGGVIKVTPRPGLANYPAIRTLALTSKASGRTSGSFHIQAARSYTVSADVSLPGAKAAQRMIVRACPLVGDYITDWSSPIACACPAGPLASPRIIGGMDGVYIDDSNICAAAIHAGRITDQGGVVLLVPGKTFTSYPAAPPANGLTPTKLSGVMREASWTFAPASAIDNIETRPPYGED